MALAYIFPGQGSQKPGMGKDLYDAYPEVREIFARAEKLTGTDWAQISFESDKKTLSLTEFTQPCLFLNSTAVLRQLNNVTQVSAVAGHSLGEYSALHAASVLSFEDALHAVVERGILMSQAKSGGMLAPLGADDEKVQDVIKDMRDSGIIVIANYNSPGQLIVSGEEKILEPASEKLKEIAGAKRVLRLPVSAAFHSPLMEEAKREMSKILEKIDFSEPKMHFFANATGTRLENPDQIRKQLIEQITSPVRWIDQVEAMGNYGMDEFVEIGPGKVLQGLVSRILPQAEVRGISTVDDIEKENKS